MSSLDSIFGESEQEHTTYQGIKMLGEVKRISIFFYLTGGKRSF
jgi:hypothetical protein